jgi:PAS domain S-box-containing protein
MNNNLNLEGLKENQNINLIRNEVLFVVNNTNTITDIEPTSNYILGLSQKDLIGKNFSTFLIDEYRDFSFFDFMFPKDKVILTFKAEYSYTHVEVSYQHICDSNNNIIGAYGSIVDISDYIKYKQRLDMISRLLDNSKDIIYHYQVFPEPKFTYISKSLEAVLGHSVEQDYNDPLHIFNITHPDDVSTLEKKAAGELDFSKPIITRWRHQNGNYIWMEDYAIPVYNHKGMLIGVQGICRNISEKVHLEHKLKLLTEINQ